MKCPKCGYLGFEHVDRCRNCGYDFSLTSPAAAPDLSIRHDSAVESPLDDLSLLDSTRGQDGSRTVTVTPDLHGVLGAPVSAKSAKSAYSTAGELPLFGAIPGDEPLITKASAEGAARRQTRDSGRLPGARRAAAAGLAGSLARVRAGAVDARAAPSGDARHNGFPVSR